MPRHMLITAGPTWEPIDAVRYLANRSSGRLGIHVAEAAHVAGWEVTLLLGAGATAPPPAARAGPEANLRTLRFESTADLERLLAEHFPTCDVLVMAAAVSDYRPRAPSPGKWLRGAARLVLELEPTPDLVAACAARRRPEQLIIGFALEEPAVLAARAREKLAQKGLDAIVANPLETMGAERIRATLYTATAETIRPPAAELTKHEFAAWLVGWIDERLRRRA